MSILTERSEHTLMNSENPTNWPKGMIYTDPISFEKVFYSFPDYDQIAFPTIEWLFSIIFKEYFVFVLDKHVGLQIGRNRVEISKNGKDALLAHLPTNGFNLIIEPSITFRVSGGKGGFGSMLRAQGGRMNSKKSTNNDACRDLAGRRLKTVRTAERLVEYQEAEAQRKRIQKEELDKRIAKKLKVPVKRKILFDDNEYLEQSEQLKLGMRSAVSLTVSSQPESLFKASNKRTASVFDDEVSSTEESNSDEASSLSESSEDASEFGEVSANESCKVGQFKKRKVLALKKGPN